MEYCGARFYKCDLHMHTPMDRHWREVSTKISSTDDDNRKRKISRLYLRGCHNAGLEVIAITDHNFAESPEHSFLKWLRAENSTVARELNKPPLHIFGGFEIQADVGKGHHVLCLLPIDVELNLVETRLVECGLGADARYDDSGKPRPSNKNLVSIIETIQKKERHEHTGIVICPHPFNAKGLLCDGNAEMWLQQEEFRNPDLLCLEIPKIVNEMPEGLKKLLEGGKDCHEEWKRKRPIAYIMSSDCYRIDCDTNDPTNHIGHRYTWIKMSRPSIESLRQAFLDRDSRIRFGNRNPQHLYAYSRIKRIQVKGATFYRGHSLDLSSNLNCIIGSRGTGKSTLLDYLRVTLDKLRETDLPEGLRNDIMDRVRNTLPSGSQVIIDIEKDAVPYRVEYNIENTPVRKIINLNTGTSEPQWDIRSLFNLKILSQHEIDKIIDSKDQTYLLRLLDGFILAELDKCKEKSHEIISGIEQIEIKITNLKEKQANRPRLETERESLSATLGLLERIKKPLQRWEIVSEDNNLLIDLKSYCNIAMQKTEEHIDNLDILLENIEQPNANSQNNILLKKANSMVFEAHQHFLEALKSAIETFRSEAAQLQTLYNDEWTPIYEKEVNDFNAIKVKLAESGDNPEEFLHYKAQLDTVNESIALMDKELHEIKNLNEERNTLLLNLRECWTKETDLRKKKAKEIMNNLSSDIENRPLVKISVQHKGEISQLVTEMSAFIKDRRSLKEEDILELISTINRINPGQSTSLAEKVIEECKLGKSSEALRQSLAGKLDVFLKWFNESTIRKLEIIRIPDKVLYHIHRKDGTLVGPIQKASVGQKGLAFLDLLLASGSEPIIVDTPEEGLDNEGVYAELVPMFRREKERRQVIVATHNANIPVNADAELIVALEAAGFIEKTDIINWIQQLGQNLDDNQIRHLEDLIGNKKWETELKTYLVYSLKWTPEDAIRLIGKVAENRRAMGYIRKWQETPSHHAESCIGALDCISVKNTVQDIMEGSREAFTKRKEKYGF